MNIIVDQLEEVRTPVPPPTTIREAARSDEAALERLSDLEDAHPGSAPHLVVEQDGEIVASLSLEDDVALGDPFRPTANLIALLRVRAAQLLGGEHAARPRGRRLTALVATAVAGRSMR